MTSAFTGTLAGAVTVAQPERPTSETSSPQAAQGPRAGRLVVDLSRARAAMMMGDLVARVIKIENPGTGDDTRGWGPPFAGPEDDPQATYFLSCNRNKESMTLDLKSEDGQTALRQLLERADVVVEDFRPGVLERLGFSTDVMHDINPRLVILSITGFGHDGPESHRSGLVSCPDDTSHQAFPIKRVVWRADLDLGIFATCFPDPMNTTWRPTLCAGGHSTRP